MANETTSVVVKTLKHPGGETLQTANQIAVNNGHLFVFDGHGSADPRAVYAPGAWTSAEIVR